jgi:hypothetical protein
MDIKITSIDYAPNTVIIASLRRVHYSEVKLFTCNNGGTGYNTMQPFHHSLMTKSRTYKEIILSKLN